MRNINIWNAALNGDLKAVKKFLATHPELLDKSFGETSPLVEKDLADILCMKNTSHLCNFFGGLGLTPYLQDMKHWTPLDCAVFGYLQGNKTLSVVRHLIAEGANGAFVKDNPNKKYFTVLGERFKNFTIVSICKNAIALRETQKALRQTDRREGELAQRVEALNAQYAQLQETLGNAEAANARQREEIRRLTIQGMHVPLQQVRYDQVSPAAASAHSSAIGAANAAGFFVERTPSRAPSTDNTFMMVERPETNPAFGV